MSSTSLPKTSAVLLAIVTAFLLSSSLTVILIIGVLLNDVTFIFLANSSIVESNFNSLIT